MKKIIGLLLALSIGASLTVFAQPGKGKPGSSIKTSLPVQPEQYTDTIHGIVYFDVEVANGDNYIGWKKGRVIRSFPLLNGKPVQDQGTLIYYDSNWALIQRVSNFSPVDWRKQ